MVRPWAWVALLLGLGGFALTTEHLGRQVRKPVSSEMQVVLPRIFQVVAAGGDRYLAANIAVVRSLLNTYEAKKNDYFITQGQVQMDAAWLNSRHEDNYYLAAAALSWTGHVTEANDVLAQAADSRNFDMLPPLYLGFNHFYFLHDGAAGARWMYEAAKRADDEQNRIGLSRIASRWAERGQDARQALAMVETMISQSRGAALKAYLQQRAERLGGLIALQDAADLFRQRTGRGPKTLDDLVRFGAIKAIPPDPQGMGYALDAEGVPILKQPAIVRAPEE